MNFPYSIQALFLSAGLLVAAPVGAAAATAPISLGFRLESGTTTTNSFRQDYGAWFVADLTDPVTPAPIQLGTDSSAGRWTQELTFGQPIPAVRPGDTFVLQELLAYSGGNFVLDNWNQEILTPGWVWTEGTLFNNTSAEPLGGLQVSVTGSHIGFAFDALPAGTDFFAVSTLQYSGLEGAAQFPITVQAFVVPEPGTVALMALGCAGLLASALSRQGSRNGRDTTSPNQIP